jgi:hypothetical protein
VILSLGEPGLAAAAGEAKGQGLVWAKRLAATMMKSEAITARTKEFRFIGDRKVVQDAG